MNRRQNLKIGHEEGSDDVCEETDLKWMKIQMATLVAVVGPSSVRLANSSRVIYANNKRWK